MYSAVNQAASVGMTFYKREKGSTGFISGIYEACKVHSSGDATMEAAKGKACMQMKRLDCSG